MFKTALLATLGSLLSSIALAQFSQVQDGSGIAPSSVVCNIITSVAVGVGATSSCAGAGATCNGVASDKTAFDAFNTWATATWQAAHTGTIELFIPAGKNCRPCTVAPTHYAVGITKFLVSMYGATITGDGACPIQLGGANPIPEVTTSNALILTASAGNSFVTLVTLSQASRFRANSYVVIYGVDMQGQGSTPPNPAVWEYNYITSIVGAQINLRNPLRSTYKSTWPKYYTTDTWIGGPATIAQTPVNWDVEIEYRGGTINLLTSDMYAFGRSIAFRNVTWPNFNTPPTQALSWTFDNVTAGYQEADKYVENFYVKGGTISQIHFQSAGSFRNMYISDGANVPIANGTPSATYITGANTTIGTLSMGPSGFGYSRSLSCTAATVNALGWHGAQSTNVLDGAVYSISNGTITMAAASAVAQPPAWAIPGANVMFVGQYDNSGVFQIGDISQDGSGNVIIPTSLSISAFPSGLATAGNLYIWTHPMPLINSTCVGAGGAILSASGQQNKPLFSYSQNTYNQTLSGAGTAIHQWGNLTSYEVNITTPYAGTTTPLAFLPTGQFVMTVQKSDYSTYSYVPSFNARQQGDRIVTGAGVTCDGSAGGCSGDTSLTLTSVPTWLPTGPVPYLAAHAAGAWAATVTMVTDQGVVTPP